MVRPFSLGASLPLKSVGEITAGARIIWDPVRLRQPSSDAEVTTVILTAKGSHLVTMEPQKAAARVEWQLFERPQVIALVFGPQGLNEGKIQSLIGRDTELLKSLADYADQSSRVESLIQELADAEQSGVGTDAVLKGFSSQYGVAAPKLDIKASSDQQASILLKALLPAANAYDPLGAKNAQAQQSGGLAASVAGMFFGNPVALAAGGAALFQNLKTALFPDIEFRSAFTQSADKDDFALCTKSLAPKAKTRTAYLWAYRVPEYKKPELSLDGPAYLPLGSRSKIGMKLDKGSSVKQLDFARDWRLVPIAGGAPISVGVRAPSGSALEVDLSKVNAPAGDYRLAATWDWSPISAEGTLHVHSCADFKDVALAPGERDRLVEGNGTVSVKLTGTDFEFLENVAVEPIAQAAKPVGVSFNLPLGERRGPQDSVRLNLGTEKQGLYRLLLAQSDGIQHVLPITILPPNPKISNCPIRLNQGELRKAIQFEGSGMERIESIASKAGEITGAPNSHGWSGEIVLKSGLVTGQKFPVIMKVRGLEAPLTVRDALEVIGPRPKIRSVRKSIRTDLGIDVDADELPAGTPVGLVLDVDQISNGGRPRLEVACDAGELRKALTLSPGEVDGKAALTFAGPGALYLSMDPGAVGYAGCRLAATLILDPEGRSDRVVLGRVIRVPRLHKFTLTNEKVGDSSFAGVLEGRDLDVIEKTGWDAAHGVFVDSIPTPLPGDSAGQTLRVTLPWPAPAPHAPLFIWLRGETSGRKTAIGD